MDDSDLDDDLRGDRPACVISGGQTGADRGALIAAAVLGYRCGGFCPKGRLAEDGRIPDAFIMEELETANYPERTRANVEFADATVVFSYEDKPTGGTALTLRMIRELSKPCLHLVLKRGSGMDNGLNDRAAKTIRGWLREERPRILNVAGPRESKEPGIGEHVTEIMLRALLTKDWCLCGRAIPESVWEVARSHSLPVVCAECGRHSRWDDFS